VLDRPLRYSLKSAANALVQAAMDFTMAVAVAYCINLIFCAVAESGSLAGRRSSRMCSQPSLSQQNS